MSASFSRASGQALVLATHSPSITTFPLRYPSLPMDHCDGKNDRQQRSLIPHLAHQELSAPGQNGARLPPIVSVYMPFHLRDQMYDIPSQNLTTVPQQGRISEVQGAEELPQLAPTVGSNSYRGNQQRFRTFETPERQTSTPWVTTPQEEMATAATDSQLWLPHQPPPRTQSYVNRGNLQHDQTYETIQIPIASSQEGMITEAPRPPPTAKAQSNISRVRRLDTTQDSSTRWIISTTAPVMADTLEFVNTNGPPSKNDKAARLKVKSHVMRQVHHQRRVSKLAKKTIRPILPHVCNQPATATFVSATPQPVPQQQIKSIEVEEAPSSLYAGFEDPSTPRQSEASRYEPPQAFTVTVACEGCGKVDIFHCPQEEALALVPHTARPQDGPSGGIFGPFTALSIEVTHFMHKMIHHFIYVHIPSINPKIYGKGNQFSPSIYLVQLGVTDAAAVYSMVAIAAYHRSVLMGKAKNEEGARSELAQATGFLFESMRLLQRKFDDIREALSNTSIFVTAMLATCMGIIANKVQLDAHYKGMMRMVELRGGIDTLPRTVANQVSRIDSNAAWMFKTKPVSTMYRSRFRTPTSNALILASLPLAVSSGCSPFTDKRLENFLCTPLFSIACDLLRLTSLLELHISSPSKIGLQEREYFEDTFAACQHGLAGFPHPENVIAKSAMLYRQHCFRLAAFIYFNTGIRVSPTPKLLSTMTSGLIDALQESDLSGGWGGDGEILLWVLFMGYVGSWEPFEKGWFLQEAKRIVRRLGLRGVEEIEGLLRAFLYRRSTFREPLGEMWEEFG